MSHVLGHGDVIAPKHFLVVHGCFPKVGVKQIYIFFENNHFFETHG